MSNKKTFFNYFIVLFIIILTPSCIKYYQLSKEEFPQGKELDDSNAVVAKNMKKVSVYDQFHTEAIFDTLWLSDPVRRAYTNIHCQKKGKDEQAKQAMLSRQLEENKHWITFYVLADIRDKNRVSLTDQNSYWSVFLKLSDGQKLTPESIKEIDMEPEYQALFGYRFNNFKRSYAVKFAAADLAGNFYLKKSPKIELYFSSPKRESFAEWQEVKLTKKEKFIKDEDFYWI